MKFPSAEIKSLQRVSLSSNDEANREWLIEEFRILSESENFLKKLKIEHEQEKIRSGARRFRVIK